ncbi:unnamed protein product [Haemonchus placei]|uniref:Secreted protein n=1 Tax=Haemonchus placei TaxID=6290 RepID=A0A158QM97_HAEPC|nr:unnamed protein product [Haemonchus placei]
MIILSNRHLRLLFCTLLMTELFRRFLYVLLNGRVRSYSKVEEQSTEEVEQVVECRPRLRFIANTHEEQLFKKRVHFFLLNYHHLLLSIENCL